MSNKHIAPSVMRLYRSCLERRDYYRAKGMEIEAAVFDKGILEIEQEFGIDPEQCCFELSSAQWFVLGFVWAVILGAFKVLVF